MYYPKYFNTAIDPMPPGMDFSAFITEWKRCKAGEGDEGKVLLLGAPLLNHWERMLRDVSLEKDINFATLYNQLSPLGDPREVIDAWVGHHDRTSSLTEELQLQLFELLRRLKHLQTARPERVIAFTYKSRLYTLIKNYALKERVRARNGTPDGEPYTELDHPDWIYLRHFDKQLTRWERYLFSHLIDCKSTNQMAVDIGLPRETFYYEERDLWNKLLKSWPNPVP